MDESWRVPVGSVVPRRRSTEQHPRRPGGGLDPDDFRDVFGGPPRSVLLRQFSGDDLAPPSSSRLDRPQRRPSFYEEVFRQAREVEAGSGEGKGKGAGGRSLPDFTIPAGGAGGGRGGLGVKTGEGFYDDIFGTERRSRTRSRQSTSKSNASSVLSSEDGGGELGSPRRPYAGDDAVLTSFASKLRPITIPSRRGGSPSPTPPSGGEQISSRRTSTVPCLMGFHFEYGAAGPAGLFRPHSPPETVAGVEPRRPAATDGDSPSSEISSIYDIPMATIRPVRSHERVGLQGSEKGEEVVEEAESSYVIEIVAGRKEAGGEGSAAVDEAIAWAKERCRASPTLEGRGVGGDDKYRSEHGKSRERVPGRTGEGLQDVLYHLEILRDGYSDVSTLEGRTTEETKVWIADDVPHKLVVEDVLFN